MPQLLALIATDAEHVPSLLYSLRKVLASNTPSDDWSIGYYADDHALTIHKPGELLEEPSLYGLANTVRSPVLIASVEPAASGAATAPYRFKNWLFGWAGNLDGLAQVRGRVVEALPGFVRSSLGESPSLGQLAFGMVLRELQVRGALNDGLAEGRALGDALKRTVEAMNTLTREAGLEAPTAAFALSNGRHVAAGSYGHSLVWRRQEGLEAMPGGPTDFRMDDIRLAAQLKAFRAFILCARGELLAGDWQEVSKGRTICVDRQLGYQET